MNIEHLVVTEGKEVSKRQNQKKVEKGVGHV